MPRQTFNIHDADKAIYSQALTEFHEAYTIKHNIIMDKLRAAAAELVAKREAELLDEHAEALSILDLPCYVLEGDGLTKGKVRDFLRLYPQVLRKIDEPAEAFDPELQMRHNPTLDVYEIVYCDGETESYITQEQTMERLKPIYDSYLLQGILASTKAEVFWVEEHALAVMWKRHVAKVNAKHGTATQEGGAA